MVVGCAREADAVDSLLGAVSVALNVGTGWLKNRGQGAFGVWELASAGEWGGLVTWSVPGLGCRRCPTAWGRFR